MCIHNFIRSCIFEPTNFGLQIVREALAVGVVQTFQLTVEGRGHVAYIANVAAGIVEAVVKAIF